MKSSEQDSLFGDSSTGYLSDDGRYRYTLDRRWGEGPTLTFVMLNPSTADASNDDPTIRRCRGFARRDGFGALTVVNLYSFRATQPTDLWTASDPVGPRGDEVFSYIGGPVVAAWGAFPVPYERVARVVSLLPKDLLCLGVTKSGHPRHPLYVRADAPLVRWAHSA